MTVTTIAPAMTPRSRFGDIENSLRKLTLVRSPVDDSGSAQVYGKGVLRSAVVNARVDDSVLDRYDPGHMRPRVKRSPRSRCHLARQVRRGLGMLLLLGCLPSLLFNVGTGRGLVIHDHWDQSLHTHVLAVAHQHDHSDWHARQHGHGHGHDDADAPDGHDVVPQPIERHSETVIRGTEVTVSKKHESATEIGSIHPMLVPPVLSTAAPPISSPPPRGWPDPAGGVRRTELACLRAVVLLI